MVWWMDVVDVTTVSTTRPITRAVLPAIKVRSWQKRVECTAAQIQDSVALGKQTPSVTRLHSNPLSARTKSELVRLQLDLL